MKTNVIINKIEDGMTGCLVADLLLKNFESIVNELDRPAVEIALELSTSEGSENRVLSQKVASENILRLDTDKIGDAPNDNNTYVRKNNNWVKETEDKVLSVAGKKGNVTLNKSDVGLYNVDNTSDENKPISNAVKQALLNKADNEALLNIIDSKGLPNGIATLDKKGYLTISQLPTDLNDVIEVDTYEDLPNPGEKGKIYIIIGGKDENELYRWSGVDYVKVGSLLEIGETENTAYAGSKGKLNATDILTLFNRKLDKTTFNDTVLELKRKDKELEDEMDNVKDSVGIDYPTFEITDSMHLIMSTDSVFNHDLFYIENGNLILRI